MRDEFLIMVSSDNDNEATYDSPNPTATKKKGETLKFKQIKKACHDPARKLKKNKLGQ